MRKMLPSTLSLAVFVIAVSTAAAQSPSSSASPPPPPRLPANANAVMRVEVAKLLASPMAKELDWQAKLMKGYADRPLAVPPTAKRVTVVAGMHPAGMRAIWQAAVIELGSPVRLDPLLRAQGGYLDRVGGKQAAWTPRDVFYVEFDPNTLGVLRPGQRQVVTRWVNATDAPELSPYLKQAWSGSSKADVLLAMDLDDLVGATALRYADSMGKFPSLDKLQAGEDKLFASLASVKGLQLTINVDKAIKAQLVADFDQDVSALGPAATAFVRDVLNDADVEGLGLEQWQFAADGKRIAGKGEMDAESLGRLIAMLAPAHAGDAVVASEASQASAKLPGDSTSAGDPKQDAAAASQKYYQAVSGTLDSIGKSASPTQTGSAFVNKARRIEQLPILNVDPALVDWGNLVAEAFNKASQELAIGQRKADAAAQGVASPTAYVSYTDQAGSGNSTPETRAAFRNAAQQRRQVSQSERAAAADRAFTIMNQVLPSRGKIRADMTQKYGVEF